MRNETNLQQIHQKIYPRSLTLLHNGNLGQSHRTCRFGRKCRSRFSSPLGSIDHGISFSSNRPFSFFLPISSIYKYVFSHEQGEKKKAGCKRKKSAVCSLFGRRYIFLDREIYICVYVIRCARTRINTTHNRPDFLV